MIVLMRKGVGEAEISELLGFASGMTASPPEIRRSGDTTLLHLPGTGSLEDQLLRDLRGHPLVADVISQDPVWLLASRAFHPESTRVDVGGVEIGGERVVLMAGPCSVENEAQLRSAAEAARAGGARILRGGAWKPRTSPWAFQGLHEEGLEMLRREADALGLPVVTEVMAPDTVDLVASRADMLQVGSRNIQNFPLLEAVGRQRKPVLLKRGMMSTLDEFLAAADYVLCQGNPNVVLCERGIRTFVTRTRNTLDVAAIPLLKSLTHLPVIADPSHATGRADLVQPCALAALAAGADGLLIEIHPTPETALSDGPQALLPEAFRELASAAERIVRALGRSL